MMHVPVYTMSYNVVLDFQDHGKVAKLIGKMFSKSELGYFMT